MRGLRTAYQHPALLPIDVLPCQAVMLGRASEPCVPAQSEDQPPLGIGTCCKDLLGILPRDEVELLRVALDRRLEILEGIRQDYLPA